MKFTKISALALTIGLFSCNNNNKIDQADTIAPKKSNLIIGNYVSNDYEKRKEGYDWMAVQVTEKNDNTVHISIRSRADVKKPTCTFDADAKRLNDTVYMARVLSKNILFNFNANNISISPEHKEDIGVLNYFCSGGGSLAGIFNKIKEPLDTTHIDKTTF